MATNFLMFCRASIANGMAFLEGVSGVECAAGEGRMCTRSGEGATGSGLLVAWAMALEFNFMGIG